MADDPKTFSLELFNNSNNIIDPGEGVINLMRLEWY